jgi:hypothetical protein
MTKALTLQQAEALSFMITFYAENDQLPPIAALAIHLGIWENHAHQIAVALEKKGYITRNTVGKFKFTEAGRMLALDHLGFVENARWPILGAKPLESGNRLAGEAVGTRDTTKLQQQAARATSPTARTCRPAPVNGPLSLEQHSVKGARSTGVPA